jgi:Holliday junction resolvasome RuvABC endonuclease subunit
MIVVGVDAAIRRSGWAIVEDDAVVETGVIHPPLKLDRANRVWTLYQGMSDVCNHARQLNRGKVCVVLERPGGWARAKERSTQVAVETLAMARAAAMIAATWVDAPVVELEVNETRTLVLGATRAPRGQDIKAWVRRTLEMAVGVDYGDPDVADAVVVALAGYRLWKVGDRRFPVFRTG